MRKVARIGSLGMALLLSVGNILSGLYHRIYPDGDGPGVTHYLEITPPESDLTETLRARAFPQPAAALSGSNTVWLSGTARGSSSASAALTVIHPNGTHD